MHSDRHVIVFKTALGWAGAAATEQGICRVVLPKRDKAVVEAAFSNSELVIICQVKSGTLDAKLISGKVSCSHSGLDPESRCLSEKSLDSRFRGNDESSCTFDEVLSKAVQMLRKYFSGEHVSFDLPLDMRYYTAFQQAVWRATAEIRFGETRSYAWIAKRIRNPRAVRAVGQAMGANPVPVIVP
jgi:O6-methylguanine-DNA--protein-cysteine methyltransferase